MKIKLFVMGIIMSAVAGSAQANIVTIEQINTQQLMTSVATMALINWKVGDMQDSKVSLSLGMEGTMHKEATKEEGNGIWIKNVLTLPIQSDTQELLIDRTSGKTLKYVHNGKEEQMPESNIEIIGTKNETITVPAGTFKVTHVSAKSKDVQAIEIWMNPRDISLDGAAKEFLDQGMIKITLELTSFKKQ
ncbi:MAG: hypothetical protein HY074_15075 [Deltaproteobacteria bacterium]|nr:hypothetical protein [Deltaproteobacteria bacterium]